MVGATLLVFRVALPWVFVVETPYLNVRKNVAHVVRKLLVASHDVIEDTSNTCIGALFVTRPECI